METVTLTIDGRSLTVDKGKTVLEAAIHHGIHVPYYCYHPGLGVDGSCRVCIVKIEKMAKLQTACSTPCAEGMSVITNAPDVIAARASVFEFLLVNHPLDCPVCDKGGEWVGGSRGGPGLRAGPAPACLSFCSSITRSTARCATRVASARCRIFRT